MHALDKRQIRRSEKNYTGPNLAGPKCTGEGEGSAHPGPRPGSEGRLQEGAMGLEGVGPRPGPRGRRRQRRKERLV